MFWSPAVRVENVGVKCWVIGRVPDGGKMVDCVGGDGEDGALGEMVVAYCDAGARWDNTGEAERGGGVDAEGFGYYVVETVGGRSAPHPQNFKREKNLALKKRGGAY